MDFDFECCWCGTDNWVHCPDVGFWGHKYRAPDEFTCWCCGESSEPFFD